MDAENGTARVCGCSNVKSSPKMLTAHLPSIFASPAICPQTHNTSEHSRILFFIPSNVRGELESLPSLEPRVSDDERLELRIGVRDEIILFCCLCFLFNSSLS
jgi:hypothetical protein